MDCLKNVLLLCVQFPQGSDERYIMRNFAQIFLPLLYVFGRSDSAIDKAQKLFNAGKWADLWNHAKSHTDKNRARLESKPRSNAPRTVD
jgi:hypothetical protein